MGHVNLFFNKSQFLLLNANFVARDKGKITFSNRVLNCVIPNGTRYVDSWKCCIYLINDFMLLFS